MKIAFITFEYPPFIIGGAGVYAQNITRELARLGHEVVVFTPQIVADKHNISISKNLRIRGVRIHNRLPFKALQFWINLPGEIKKADKEYGKFDVLHFNGISYWFLRKRIYPAPHVITIHHLVVDAIRSNNLTLISRVKNISGENSFFIPFIEKRCVMSADKIISVSKFTKEKLIEYYSILPDKIEVIYNGTNLSDYNYTKEDIEEIKNKFGLGNKPIILFVGRIDDPRKGLDILLKSFKIVLENVDATLLVVGKGNQEIINKLSKNLKIQKNVVFAGYVDDDTLKKFYALCNVYVCPSRLEGFGLTIIEAMAAGKPIVATNVGAIPELIKNYEIGILIEPYDVQRMSDAIIKFIYDARYPQRIGKFNREHLIDEFRWNHKANELENLYKEVIGVE